ncbi:Histone-lysine N-methyltransferase, H3 lysine-9 specific SUVH5 [Apostasia shenzhenica]|uniref:Histone-lysine N-methyltransferase, H3 lysine-9 specific SUVH5 n=1 Tax=Apostasia shenzhenica TaxID=1088818 RepID=A0A2I0AJ97_9ASPA|nr:Histone-lysine N-methyltransferase, H3 lysine-9 specific SUVH5 [Apostasia shenzhenica]
MASSSSRSSSRSRQASRCSSTSRLDLASEVGIGGGGGGGGWVHDALKEFRRLCSRLRPRRTQRVDQMVVRILKEKGQWPRCFEPVIGSVPGVAVGDEFFYRMELLLVGLHRPPENGIDYQAGSGIATSIVASGGYSDICNLSGDILTYIGSGGCDGRRKRKASDQKLEKGNMALTRSMTAKTPVRVIYGLRNLKESVASVFVYDGLYFVENYRRVRGGNGCYVLEFQLRRKPGQPRCWRLEARLQ